MPAPTPKPPQPCYAEAANIPGRFSFHDLTPELARELHAWAKARGIRNMNLRLSAPSLNVTDNEK